MPTDQTRIDQVPTDQVPTDQVPTDRTRIDQTLTDQTSIDAQPIEETPTRHETGTTDAAVPYSRLIAHGSMLTVQCPWFIAMVQRSRSNAHSSLLMVQRSRFNAHSPLLMVQRSQFNAHGSILRPVSRQADAVADERGVLCGHRHGQAAGAG